MPAPKSLSSAQKPVMTGPGTPYSFSARAKVERYFSSWCCPLTMRLREISLPRNSTKLCPKKVWRRSRAMMLVIERHVVEDGGERLRRHAGCGGLAAEFAQPTLEADRCSGSWRVLAVAGVEPVLPRPVGAKTSDDERKRGGEPGCEGSEDGGTAHETPQLMKHDGLRALIAGPMRRNHADTAGLPGARPFVAHLPRHTGRSFAGTGQRRTSRL